MTFSASISASIFSSIFHENGSQNGPKKYMGRETVLLTFRDLVFYVDLCWFYVEFGSLWAPFWLPLAHFWLPLAHFWLPLAPFWLTFGVPWLTFGALSFTFAHPGIHFLTFAVSCPHFSYLFEFSMKISCKIWFLHNFFRLFRAALASRLVGLTEACLPKKAEGEGLTIDRINFENHILSRSSRIFPKRIERTPTESTSSLVTHPSRARSGTFAAGNLD